jgi:predicted RNA-binding Zn-ribbon protein involved in translation (DUF1610 family)
MHGNMSLEYALRYAAAGLRVHPLYEVDPATQVCACPAGAECTEKQRGKHPRLGAWQQKATTNAEEVRAWWSRWPRAGVGLATGSASRCWVLDLDGPEAGAWYEAQVQKHGLTRTLGVHTSRGFHLYWRWPADAVVKNAQGLKAVGAPNVDVRGEGGYVCAPPTVHRSGHVYTWETQLAAFQREMVEAPAWLLEIVKERPKPPPKRPIRVEPRAAWTREAADRELARMLRLDPSARVSLGASLQGDIMDAAGHVRHVRCPRCGDRSVWWTISGPGHAKCSHVNSCGFIAPLVNLCT